MAYLSASFSLARAVSSAITGVVFSLTTDLGGWMEFSIPCFVAATPLVITAFLMVIYLPGDTHLKKRRRMVEQQAPVVELIPVNTSASSQSDDGQDDTDALVQSTDVVCDVLPLTTDEEVAHPGDANVHVPTAPPLTPSITPLNDDDPDIEERGLLSNNSTAEPPKLLITSPKPLLSSAAGDFDDGGTNTGAATVAAPSAVASDSYTPRTPAAERIKLRQGLRMMAANRNVLWLTVIYALNSFCNGSILVVLVLQFSLPHESVGYGMSPAGVSAAMGIFGTVSFVFQVQCALTMTLCA